MTWLILVITEFFQLGEGMITRSYAKKYGDGGFKFNAIISLFAVLFYIVSDKNGFNFPKELWIYGIISSVVYVIGFYATYIALRIGSYILTNVIASFSTVFVIVYGLMVLHEPSNPLTYVGLFVIFVAMILIMYPKQTPQEKKPFSLKWLIAALASAAANGMINIISRMQQIRFDNECTNEFLIISLLGSFIVLLIGGIVTDGAKIKSILKSGSLFGLSAGVFNGIKNLLNLVVYLYIPISLASPIKMWLNKFLAFAVSVVIYKEKFSKIQLFGIILSIIAIILLGLK